MARFGIDNSRSRIALAGTQVPQVPGRVDASFAEVYSETGVAEAAGLRLALIRP